MKLQKIKKKFAESRSIGVVASRPTAHQRGYDYRWQQARIEYLQQNPFCVHCLPLYVAATVVDHVVPHRGDKVLFWDRNNWQSLCKTCHDSWKQAQEARDR